VLQGRDNPDYRALMEYTINKFNEQLAEIALN
jgi:hypothetical protein